MILSSKDFDLEHFSCFWMVNHIFRFTNNYKVILNLEKGCTNVTQFSQHSVCIYLSVCDKTTMVNHVHKSKSPSKSAKCQMSRTKLSTHHSYDSSFVLVGAESQKRELRKRRRKTKKSLLCYVWTTHSYPLLFFVTMTTMMMFLHHGQRHICLKRNKRKTVSSICDAGILFTMTNYHSGSFQIASVEK